MTNVEMRNAFITAIEALSTRRNQLAYELMQAEDADDMVAFDGIRDARKELRNVMKILQTQVQDINNQFAADNEYAWADQQFDRCS